MMKRPFSNKFISILVLILIIFLPGYYKYRKLNLQNEQMKKRIQDFKTSNSKVEQEIELLKKDNEYRETVAREKLGVVKKGEVVYKLKNQ